jgi:hypothetical protein
MPLMRQSSRLFKECERALLVCAGCSTFKTDVAYGMSGTFAHNHACPPRPRLYVWVSVCESGVLVYGKRLGGALRTSTSSSLDSTVDEEWLVSGERSNGDCVSNLFDKYIYCCYPPPPST